MSVIKNGFFCLGERALRVGGLSSEGIKSVVYRGFHDRGVIVEFDDTTITGEKDIFVLWRNTQWDPRKILAYVGEMVSYQVDVRIGPAVDRGASASGTPVVREKAPNGRCVYGLYVAQKHLVHFKLVAWDKMGVKIPSRCRGI